MGIVSPLSSIVQNQENIVEKGKIFSLWLSSSALFAAALSALSRWLKSCSSNFTAEISMFTASFILYSNHTHLRQLYMGYHFNKAPT